EGRSVGTRGDRVLLVVLEDDEDDVREIGDANRRRGLRRRLPGRRAATAGECERDDACDRDAAQCSPRRSSHLTPAKTAMIATIARMPYRTSFSIALITASPT